MQIAISYVTADSLSTDTDGAVFSIELATVLQANSLAFTNISSLTLDSSNNYMIMISDMDLAAAYPSTIQNVTVNSCSTGIIKIQTLTNNLTQNNMLVISNVTVSDYNVSSSIDLIALTTLTTYDRYSIIFSSMTFSNLEFVQGGNIFNLEYLIGAPVQIIDSVLNNIVGGKINVKSFTTNIANLTTDLIMSNVTVDNVNAKFDSFLILQTGAVVSVTDSIFTNIN